MVRDSGCTRCVLHKEANTVCLPSDGPDDADILFFGEAPGANEDDQGLPFVGNAGQELDLLLIRAGLPREKVRISNTVRCRPPENRTPKEDERAACMFFTVQELQEVQPKVIVALGGSALKALTGEKAIGASRGKMLSLLPEYRSDIPVLATYHPAAYLHNPGNREPYSKAIVEDMKLARKVVDGSVMHKKVVTARDSEKKVMAAIKKLSTCKELACDLEWEVIPAKGKIPKGSMPWSRRNGLTPRPVSIAIAGRVKGKLLAVSVPLLKVPWARDYSADIQELVERIPTYYHHALGDLVWLYYLGWKPILRGDTFTFSSLLDIEISRSLKSLSAVYTDMPIGYERDSGVGTVPQTKAEWRKLLTYNGNDGIATVVLKPALKKLMRKQKRMKVLKLYHHVLLPATEILARTALNGVPIDEKLLKNKRKKLLKDLRRDVEMIGDTLKLPGNYESMIGSSAKIAPYFEQLLNIKLPRTAKSNKPSLTKDILLQHKGEHKIIPVMIRRTKEDKRENSYYRPWTMLLDLQRDHHLHTTYRLTNARTGRTSAESEAGNTFQQFPRKQAVRNLVRADKGRSILAVDQSQIELRLIAWKSRDRRMLDFFKNGKDLHTAMAGFIKALDKGHSLKWYLKRMDDLMPLVTYDERFGAKPINFGLGYGGTYIVIIKTGRKDYGIIFSQEQGEQGYDAYHQFYPDVRAWQETFWRDVERGYGENCLGRRRTVVEDNEGPDGVWRKYINFDIQGPASDLALFCMNFTWELLEFEYGKYVHQVVENTGFFHDAVLLHVVNSELDIVEGIVKQAWEHPPLERLGLEIDVPLVADINIASVWQS